MHVVVTNPFAWPHVRRGAERLLNDLAAWLRSRGHRVTVFAMGPQDAEEDRDGVRYVFMRERMRSSRRQLNSLHYFAWRLQRELKGIEADAVFCLNYFDAYAALQARPQAPKPYRIVFQAVGIPTRRYFRAVPLDAWFIRRVLREADATVSLSSFARDLLQSDFGCRSLVLPPPVMTHDFSKLEAVVPEGGPIVLFVGDLDEPRKGVRALCMAFDLVKQVHPDAQLVLAGRASDATRQMLLALPRVAAHASSIRFHGVGGVHDLPDLYRQASVTVLPSVWEAFGLVLVESLAAGTPLVGAQHAGIVDIIDSPMVGRMFDPGRFELQTDNIAGLAQAILDVLVQGKTPEVIAACRARAECFSWDALGPAYEQALLPQGAQRRTAST
ncbi:glycosyltransferase family 1 protein [Albitalea terrae]|uniref:Glycosyltransferase family 1 protein n=2 Tax=Piscinibacter terrae TaxID=2496871 RepID=A0A3N7HM35_9BURK|nr:glycosyltransferase family 1 protein [Albitalea terrae]